MSETYRYRSDIPNPAHIADIALVVNTGDEFDSPTPLHHGLLVPLNKAAKDAAEAVEQANREMGARWDQGAVDAQQNASGGVVEGPVEYVVGETGPEQVRTPPKAKE